MNTLKIKILNNNKSFNDFYKKKKNYNNDSGFDLIIPEDVLFEPKETKLVKLNIKCEMLDENNDNIAFLLIPRSSIYKYPLRQSNSIGLIDIDYRGEIGIPLDNIGDNKFLLQSGTRLCQLICNNLKPIRSEITDVLSDTIRGENGFGSTGE